MTSRRRLLAASAAASLALAGCGGAALSDDPRAAVSEGIENARADGFSWDLAIESEPTEGAPAEANAFVVAARGLEMSGISHADGDTLLEVAYPGAFAFETRTLVDGDAVRTFLRVDVPALPMSAADLADVPTSSDEQVLLLELASGLLTGWVEVEGDLASMRAAGGAQRREDIIAQIEEALAADPSAPDVDVEAIVADVEETFGSVAQVMDTYLGVVEVAGAPEGQRLVDIDVLLRDVARDAGELVARHLEVPADELATFDEDLEEIPGAIGGITATLDERYLTGLRFDLGDFLTSVGEAAEMGPLPAFAVQIDLDDLGEPAAVTAPDDIAATFSGEELQAALESLEQQAGRFGTVMGGSFSADA